MNSPVLSQLAAIDARQPWFTPYSGLIDAGRQSLQAGATVAAALSSLAEQGRADARPRFVAVPAAPPGEAYEAFVARTGNIPTRDNPHDFFNGMVWLRFTQAKRRLNELQAAEIAADGVGPVRGPLRDAITLFDEGGAVLRGPPALWEALVARDWRRLFLDLRPLWRHAQLVVFGHALLEKLARPRKGLTAHVWRAQAAADTDGDTGGTGALDSWLAAQFSADRLAAKPFTPLPVLGVPGWWPENQNFPFYDDSMVFRPAGRHEGKTAMPSATSRT